jgi:hypothetical protein
MGGAVYYRRNLRNRQIVNQDIELGNIGAQIDSEPNRRNSNDDPAFGVKLLQQGPATNIWDIREPPPPGFPLLAPPPATGTSSSMGRITNGITIQSYSSPMQQPSASAPNTEFTPDYEIGDDTSNVQEALPIKKQSKYEKSTSSVAMSSLAADYNFFHNTSKLETLGGMPTLRGGELLGIPQRTINGLSNILSKTKLAIKKSLRQRTTPDGAVQQAVPLINRDQPEARATFMIVKVVKNYVAFLSELQGTIQFLENDILQVLGLPDNNVDVPVIFPFRGDIYQVLINRDSVAYIPRTATPTAWLAPTFIPESRFQEAGEARQIQRVRNDALLTEGNKSMVGRQPSSSRKSPAPGQREVGQNPTVSLDDQPNLTRQSSQPRMTRDYRLTLHSYKQQSLSQSRPQSLHRQALSRASLATQTGGHGSGRKPRRVAQSDGFPEQSAVRGADSRRADTPSTSTDEAHRRGDDSPRVAPSPQSRGPHRSDSQSTRIHNEQGNESLQRGATLDFEGSITSRTSSQGRSQSTMTKGEERIYGLGQIGSVQNTLPDRPLSLQLENLPRSQVSSENRRSLNPSQMSSAGYTVPRNSAIPPEFLHRISTPPTSNRIDTHHHTLPNTARGRSSLRAGNAHENNTQEQPSYMGGDIPSQEPKRRVYPDTNLPTSTAQTHRGSRIRDFIDDE